MSTAVRSRPSETLDPHQQSSSSCHFEDALHSESLGKMKPCRRWWSFIRHSARVSTYPDVPWETSLLLRPTGVGKTRVVEAAAEILYGDEARQFLLDAGTDQRYGARHLKRAIECFLISPLATLLATNQLRPGDLLIIDHQPQEECLTFSKHAEHHVSHPCLPQMDSKCMRRMNPEIQG